MPVLRAIGPSTPSSTAANVPRTNATLAIDGAAPSPIRPASRATKPARQSVTCVRRPEPVERPMPPQISERQRGGCPEYRQCFQDVQRGRAASSSRGDRCEHGEREEGDADARRRALQQVRVRMLRCSVHRHRLLSLAIVPAGPMSSEPMPPRPRSRSGPPRPARERYGPNRRSDAAPAKSESAHSTAASAAAPRPSSSAGRSRQASTSGCARRSRPATFPGPVKYGYVSVGEVVEGPPMCSAAGACSACIPHQTSYVVPAEAVRPLPQGVPAERAVLAANLETAINGLWDADPRIGDRIAVVGAGALGCLVAWLAGRIPGCEVELVDTNPRRADRSPARSAPASPRPVRRAARPIWSSTRAARRRARRSRSSSPGSRRRSSR